MLFSYANFGMQLLLIYDNICIPLFFQDTQESKYSFFLFHLTIFLWGKLAERQWLVKGPPVSIMGLHSPSLMF